MVVPTAGTLVRPIALFATDKLNNEAMLGASIENDAVVVPALTPAVTDVRDVLPRKACTSARSEV